MTQDMDRLDEVEKQAEQALAAVPNTIYKASFKAFCKMWSTLVYEIKMVS